MGIDFSRMDIDWQDFMEQLYEKYQSYLSVIKDICFATCEYETLPQDPQTPQELVDALRKIIDTSKELNQIIEQCPSSIYIADTEGKTLRVSKCFEEDSGLDRRPLLGKTVFDIEQENIFQPSVCGVVLKENHRVIIPQVINFNRETMVAGMPVVNENGQVFRVVTNAILNEDAKRIAEYFNHTEGENAIPADDQSETALIAKSASMQDVLKLADRVKDIQSTVLLEGETGVGKSLLARHIHNSSDRRNKRMTEINCGAIPSALLESELSGYASGAFTGADKKGKAGLIEISEGGTILLDEISELPLNLQVKLLHFLQNKRITRVGGTEEINVDVRVIAATNKDLEDLVKSGTFREDLYYRLNVVPIVIPPLRERKEDIMPAVEYFVGKYTKLYGKTLSEKDMQEDRFLDKEWRGNMRELENYVERLVITEGAAGLTGEKAELKRAETEDTAERTEGKHHEKSRPRTKGKMKQMEREMILEAYEKYKSSYKVAEELGISQSTAYRKIKRYLHED